MSIEIRSIGRGISLGIIRTEKFKNNFFGLSFVLPRNAETVANVGMLVNVLKRGSAGYPTFKALSRKLSELYDVSLNVYEQSNDATMLFRISVGFIDDSFIPENEQIEVCRGAMECIKEFLFCPLLENGEFKSDYLESERKRRIDKINAEINNKDVYAFNRAMRIACAGTPLECSQLGNAMTVSAVTSRGLLDTLNKAVYESRVEAVFAGKFTDINEKYVTELLNELRDKRVDGDFSEGSEAYTLAQLDGKEVIETVKAKQGRMVLTYLVPKTEKGDMSLSVFTEIFGASPVSRLFANVRERLSLCYYCSATAIKEASLLIVRSGLDGENRALAISEIQRQLDDLSCPENIGDDEIDAAKASLLSMLKTLTDSTLAYSMWYVRRRLGGADTDLEGAMKAIESVTKEDVARIAKGAKLQLSYFLEGTEG